MGKGDKKSRRGKIIIGSFGVRRPRRIKKEVVIADKATKAKPKKISEPKPHKVVEEPAVIIEPKVVTPVIESPAQGEIPLDITPSKAPVKKTAAKKATPKVEKAEKPESGEVKPKTPKTKKKAGESAEEKEKAKED